MPIERLTSEDLVMLWPDQVWPQDIGALAVLDAPDFRLEDVRAAVASRLHLAPRFRQRLFVPDKPFGPPLWVDDPGFDIGRHVREMRLPPAGDEPALLGAVEQLRRRRLDRSCPLWEMWFLTGMQDGRVGMFVRTHHSVADGIAGVATLASFLDVDAGVTITVPEPWAPAPMPSEDEMLADEASARRRRRRQRLTALVHPIAGTKRVLGMAPALFELFGERSLPSTSLDRPVGASRKFALVRGRLAAMKDAAHACDAKVNDVLLTAIAGGLHGLLRSRGETVDHAVMRIYVPVSLRHGQYAGARGNSIAQMAVPLPIWEPDPLRRLRLISAETLTRKARVRPSVGALPFSGLAGRLALRLIARQRVNVESADLPGAPVPMYLAGMRMLEVFPLLPLIGRVSLGVGALSYDGQFNLGVVADGEAYPDLGQFVRGVEDDLRALALEASISSTQTVA